MELGPIKDGCSPVKQPCLRRSFLRTGMRVADLAWTQPSPPCLRNGGHWGSLILQWPDFLRMGDLGHVVCLSLSLYHFSILISGPSCEM